MRKCIALLCAVMCLLACVACTPVDDTPQETKKTPVVAADPNPHITAVAMQ